MRVETLTNCFVSLLRRECPSDRFIDLSPKAKLIEATETKLRKSEEERKELAEKILKDGDKRLATIQEKNQAMLAELETATAESAVAIEADARRAINDNLSAQKAANSSASCCFIAV